MTFAVTNAMSSIRFLAACALALGAAGGGQAAVEGAAAQDGAAMDGGYEAIDADAAPVDAQFQTLFTIWKRSDALNEAGVAVAPMGSAMSVPSLRPVALGSVNFTSGFGVRADPFRHGAAMHAGIDMAGPIGTPIYATADGVVSRAGWGNGYGNLVQITHGAGIETRYGHLSRIMVSPNTRVHRGQLIALMGSTGRSTGSHLHYEVRIDGRAVNPVPYLRSAEYAAAFDKRATTGTRLAALGGPVAD